MVSKLMIGLLIATAMLGAAGNIVNTDTVSITSNEDSSPSVSIIGGADGPTSVFIAGKLDSDDHLMLETSDTGESGISVLPLEVTMQAVAYGGGKLSVVIDNQSGSDYCFGKEYYLQKKIDGEWIDVEPEEEYSWIDIAVILNDTESIVEEYDLTVFGTLEAGEYKLLKNDLETEFTLIEK